MVAVALGAALSCRAREQAAAPPPEKAGESAAAVPVRTAAVTVASLERLVDAPGHTAALVQQKVRAPFAGTLLTLSAVDGDRVRRGDVLGTLVARDSEAALAGAKEMERQASTPAEREDARRAAELAQRDLIRSTLHSPADGVVLTHAAAAGDRVTEGEELLTLADAGSLVFVADVAQSALSQIRPGQRVSIELAGRASPVRGVVHDVLPTANAADFTAPVRVDIPAGGAPLSIGLFGNAHFVVAEKTDAVVVPDAAILRDDVTGKSRIALVENGHAHWVEVTPGLRGPAGTEIVAPPLRAGQAVIVAGQVGLPEGAAVSAQP